MVAEHGELGLSVNRLARRFHRQSVHFNMIGDLNTFNMLEGKFH